MKEKRWFIISYDDKKKVWIIISKMLKTKNEAIKLWVPGTEVCETIYGG